VKVLVIGGATFIGLAIVRQLVATGHDVTVLALVPTPQLEALPVEILRGDRRDPAWLTGALAGRRYDAVVDNFAFGAGDVDLLLDALEAANTLPERFVLTSTTNVYTWRFPRIWDESLAPDELRPRITREGASRYALGKLGAEETLLRRIPHASILRPSMVAGRDDNVGMCPPRPVGPHGPGRTNFLPCRVMDGGPIVLPSYDDTVFQLTWSHDIASAVLCLLESNAAAGRRFNIAGDEYWTNERFAVELFRLVGRRGEIVRARPEELLAAGLGSYPMPWGAHPSWSAFETHALKSIGWRPTPAEVWLRTLLEPLPLAMRPCWDNRLREIALARRLLAASASR
jgi:nucleoside-diphosphate-sugar epimerase